MDYYDEMFNDMFANAARFSNDDEIKALSDTQLNLIIAISMITAKQFSELSDKDLIEANKLIPNLKKIMDATIYNIKLLTKELTLRSLPMN